MAQALAGRSLFLSLNSDAIDVSPSTKHDAVAQILDDYQASAEQAAAIGDSANDLPFLTYADLCFAAAPTNAQPRVREVVASLKNGVNLEREAPRAFLDFYAQCTQQALRLLIADRDGVVRAKVPGADASEIFGIYRQMGNGFKPFVAILTGSSYEQNLAFIAEYRLDDALRGNEAARQRFHIYAENGALRINAVTKACELTARFDRDVVAFITNELAGEVMTSLTDRVLPKFGFTLATQPSAAPGVVYVPKKRTMLTVNVPRLGLDGSFFRDTPDADAFRREVASAMRTSLERHHIEAVQL
jgi:phosphoserine phosphatase